MHLGWLEQSRRAIAALQSLTAARFGHTLQLNDLNAFF
jgi:hypothetical protein